MRYLVPLLMLVAACDATDAAHSDDAAHSGDVAQADGDVDAQADAAPEYVPPTPRWPGPHDDRPFALSEVGLFAGDAPAPDLIAFEPTWALWSDGLAKRRWLRLPAGTTIDTHDPDHWQLPIGAVLFKEFARPPEEGGARLETRVIARTGPGPFDYWMGAFVWRADGEDADFVRGGAVDVAGTDHDVPSAEQCWSCHLGTPGRTLGLTAIQAGDTVRAALADRFSDPLPAAALEAPDDARAALGYLHANCSHCHSPTGVARPDSDLDLSLALAATTVEETGAYRTAVGVATRSWLRPEVPLRVAPGDPDHSALVVRMSARGNVDQMPPLATEHVDASGLAAVRAWIAALADGG